MDKFYLHTIYEIRIRNSQSFEHKYLPKSHNTFIKPNTKAPFHHFIDFQSYLLNAYIKKKKNNIMYCCDVASNKALNL